MNAKRDKLVRKGVRLINKFEKYARDYEMMGSFPPEDWFTTKAFYKLSKAELKAFIVDLADNQK